MAVDASENLEVFSVPGVAHRPCVNDLLLQIRDPDEDVDDIELGVGSPTEIRGLI